MSSNPMWLVPSKKRHLRHRHIQMEDDVETQGEDGHLQAKEARSGTDPSLTDKEPTLKTP